MKDEKTLTWIEFDWWAGKEFQRIQIEGRKEDTWADEEQRGIWEEWGERKEKKRCSDNVALGTTGPDPQLTSSVWPWRQAHIVTVKKWATVYMPTAKRTIRVKDFDNSNPTTFWWSRKRFQWRKPSVGSRRRQTRPEVEPVSRGSWGMLQTI